MKRYMTAIIALVLPAFFFQARGQQLPGLDFTTLQQLMQKDPKPVVIQLHTSWCMYCKMQDRQIRRDKALQKVLAEDVYYLRFDAESKDSVVFNGQSYTYAKYGPSGGIHQLAYALGEKEGRIGYPAWVILDERYQRVFVHHGLLPTRTLAELLQR